MGETTWHRYPCKFKYAKVFRENMDPGGDDNKAAKNTKKRGGAFYVDACVSDATKKRMIKDGIPEHSLGYDMFHEDDDFEGFPWRRRLKRYVITGMKDKETGEPILNDAPKVVDLNRKYEDEDGKLTAEVWTFEDGELGNGTEGEVVVSIWKGDEDQRVVTLQKLGVKEHVEYVREEFVTY